MIRQDWSSLKKLLFFQMAAGGGAAVEATATGNPLTFLTDLARPLKSLLIPFTPVQSGTGDPSPENVRPIVPWDGLKVCGAGGNLIDASQLQDGYVWWNGNKIGGYAPNCVSPLIPVKAGSTYYRQGRTASHNAVSFFDKDKAFLSQAVIQPPVSFTVPNGACYAGFTFGKDYKSEAMVNAGSSALPYVPYEPITETDISFHSPVYGGTLDVVSGVLRAGWVAIPMKNIEWDTTSATSVFTTPLDFEPLRNISNKLNVLSDMFKTESADTRIANMPNMSIKGHATAKYALYVRNEDFTRRTDFNAWLQTANPIMCFELDEPQTVQLTQAQITALIGNNTIWSDADGSMTATYLKKG